jgi:hypothetical protein
VALSGSQESPSYWTETKARNDHKLGVLMDLPASSIGVTLLATEASVVLSPFPMRDQSLRARLVSNEITNESNFINNWEQPSYKLTIYSGNNYYAVVAMMVEAADARSGLLTKLPRHVDRHGGGWANPCPTDGQKHTEVRSTMRGRALG